MNRKLKHTLTQAQGNKKRKGDRARARLALRFGRSMPSPKRQLGRKVHAGVRVGELQDATVAEFLSVPADDDLDADKQIAADLRKTGVEPPGPQEMGIALQIDPEAVAHADDTVNGMRLMPQVEACGVARAAIQADLDTRTALKDLDEALKWAQEQVDTGARVLETWQREAQGAIAAEILHALLGAKTEAERITIVRNTHEVLEVEAEALQELIDTRAKNAAAMDDLHGQVEQAAEELMFLQAFQDLKQRRPVDRSVLERMAQHYEAIADGTDARQWPRQ